MPELEKIILLFPEEQETNPKFNKNFRLYLTSKPASYFPVSVLQNGIKVTTEPPRGVKANLKRIFEGKNDAFFSSCKKERAFHKLTWALSYFHAIIQERKKFGPLGWNKNYPFNQSDLETALKMLRNLLDEQEKIPWTALLFLNGTINYGGRVTDDNDKTCIMAILDQFYKPEILKNETFQFSENENYLIPKMGTVEEYMQYIETMQIIDDPDIFGMHENANLTYQNQ